MKLIHWIKFEEPDLWEVIRDPYINPTGVYVSRMPLSAQWVVRGNLNAGLPLVIILPQGGNLNGVV